MGQGSIHRKAEVGGTFGGHLVQTLPKQGHQESPVRTMSRQLLDISEHRDSATPVPNTGAHLVLTPPVV